MHHVATGILFVVALLWIMEAIDLARGVSSIPSIADAPPLEDAGCPAVSILFAARDEGQKLPDALQTMLSLDYPDYEIVAVNDRSSDATESILKQVASKDRRLKHIRIDSLPAGWLGKPHALQEAYEHSKGEWLIFTDADVHFSADVIRLAISMARMRGWDHMPLLGCPKMFSIGEKIAMSFFGLGFVVGVRPWRASDPNSHGYAGVGAFQLIRRSAYEALGAHRRLAMEVIDDVKLGKLVKQEGFRSGVARAGNAVSVHWHAGIANMARGTTKNFFAASGFRLRVVALHIVGLLLMCVFPWIALGFVHGWAQLFAAVSVAIPIVVQAGVAIEFGSSPLYALTHPFGALIFAWMLIRSTAVTLWSGGVTWRGTFYPLEELKRGVV